MDKLLSRLGIWLISACCVLAAPVAFADSEELSASLQPSDNGVLFVLRNNSAETITVLRWETPLEPELTQDVFHVAPSTTGKPNLHAERARYSGRMFKRDNPQPDDYIEIKAGESVSAEIEITDYYRLNQDGIHSVTFSGAFETFSATNDRTILHASSGAEVIGLTTQSVAVNLVAPPERAYARIGGFNSCSAQQLAELPGDMDASETITREAREALENLAVNERATSPRYTHWFGDYSATRYNTVINIMQKAEQVMANGSVEFNCGCTENYFAYVFPIDPFKVYLCNAYWNAARTGSDSRAGTILHELSHFPEVGDTDDNAYGARSVANLAISDPNAAVNNADSIEYFAENTPFREMSSGQAPVPVQTVFNTLTIGNSVSGSVGRLESVFYEVEGADFIELTSVSGDADLYVFTSALQDEQICTATTTGVVDRCDIRGATRAYIQVLGYSDSSFSILAGRNPPASSQQLVLGETLTRSIGLNELQFYSVTGADAVTINSYSGDADLLIYSSEERAVDSLVCVSEEYTSDTPTDYCEVSGDTVFITVRGFAATDYDITSTSLAVVQQVGPTPVDPASETTDQTLDDPITLVGGSGGSSGGGEFDGWLVIALAGLLFRRRKSLMPILHYSGAR